MTYISGQLGITDNVSGYNKKAAKLADVINEYCWDPLDGIYYSVDFNLLPVNKPSNSRFTLHQA